MVGVRSPLITPPKLVLTDVKLPKPTPPNPCTDVCVSCADAVEVEDGDTAILQRAAVSEGGVAGPLEGYAVATLDDVGEGRADRGELVAVLLPELLDLTTARAARK